MMITLNLEDEFLKQIDKTVKVHNYANRTELIREALRDKLVEVQQRHIMAAIKAVQKANKTHVTKEEYEAVRKQGYRGMPPSEELFRRVGLGDVSKR